MPATSLAEFPSERTALATGWFARLADSIDRGKLAAAGAAQDELSRLGFLVTPKPPRRRRKPQIAPGAPELEGAAR